MAERKLFMALGEEAARSTPESTTVGFIPLAEPKEPKYEPNDKPREEYRGEESALGLTDDRRMDEKWSWSPKMPAYTESGGAQKGLMGTLLKHFFGKSASGQNGATGQHYHMMYPVVDMFSAANLGDKALTPNISISEGANLRLWPFVGGRIKSLSFDQEPGNQLMITAEMMGQKRGTVGAGEASPSWPAENLRLNFNSLKAYIGTITKTGTAPNYTQFGFGSATQFKPDKLSIKLTNGNEDKLRLSGLAYPDKTVMGSFAGSLEMTIDWEDPGGGAFSSVDEFAAWMAGISTTNFCFVWDTGTQAGTGDNHMLILDIPKAVRRGGDLGWSRNKDGNIVLKYDLRLDETTSKYLVGLMLKNTASAV